MDSNGAEAQYRLEKRHEMDAYPMMYERVVRKWLRTRMTVSFMNPQIFDIEALSMEYGGVGLQ
jgi:hypothetical protein